MPKASKQGGTTEVLWEDKKFYKPSAVIKKNANVQNIQKLYTSALKNPLKFWEQAADELEWYKKWKTVLDSSKKPFFKWFAGAKCNVYHNAVERHQKDPAMRKKTALLCVKEKGKATKFTYEQLYKEVNNFAGALKSLGIKKGDRVSLYLPNIAQTAISMLACAKIGAIHSVVYAGFSATALRDRINDAKAKILITADGSKRRGKVIQLKKIADEAVSKNCRSIKKVIVVKNANNTITMKPKRDVWFHQLQKKDYGEVKTVQMNAHDPLFILYTSGTTSKPKGVVHAHGGYQVGIYRTLTWVFDIKPNDIYWCTADPGWITGHSYIVYGPLISGTTSVMYDGAPDYPTPARLWEIVEKHKVTIFYTAPTLVRMLMKYGAQYPKKHNLSSLRLLGSVGEPINPEAWRWYYKHIGKNKCPIMDTWWQTETGMFVITPVPSLALKAGSATRAFFGIDVDVVDKKGKKTPTGKGGFLVIKNPWPSMLVTLFGNPKRYLETYWKKVPGVYTTGDIATRDKDGYFWIQGRSDDVLKIAGHRIGTAEVESALVAHKAVVEAGIIGIPDKIKGEVAKAFVILKKNISPSEALKTELQKHVRNQLGPIVKIEGFSFVDTLPKTRSGKIMRRVLKAKELGQPLGDTSTMEN